MPENMHAGLLTRSVAFDKPDRSDDGHGGIAEGWQEAMLAVEAQANFMYLRGGETVQAARLEGRQPIVVTIYNFAAARLIDETWRMRDLRDGDWDSGDNWTGPVFQVRGRPVPSQDRRWLEITIEGGAAT